MIILERLLNSAVYILVCVSRSIPRRDTADRKVHRSSTIRSCRLRCHSCFRRQCELGFPVVPPQEYQEVRVASGYNVKDYRWCRPAPGGGGHAPRTQGEGGAGIALRSMTPLARLFAHCFTPTRNPHFEIPHWGVRSGSWGGLGASGGKSRSPVVPKPALTARIWPGIGACLMREGLGTGLLGALNVGFATASDNNNAPRRTHWGRHVNATGSGCARQSSSRPAFELSRGDQLFYQRCSYALDCAHRRHVACASLYALRLARMGADQLWECSAALLRAPCGRGQQQQRAGGTDSRPNPSLERRYRYERHRAD